MIIVRISSGLGNQMFQYALAKHYQLKGRKVLLDREVYKTSKSNALRQYELVNFKLTIPEISDFLKNLFYSRALFWRVLRRTLFFWIKEVTQVGLSYSPAYANQTGSVVMVGYFQSEKYFKNIRQELLEDFTFQKSLKKENADYLKRIRNSNSVSIHVRRGDYVSDRSASGLLGVLPMRYYKEAILLFENRGAAPEYFIFSDDPTWTSIAMKEVLKEFVLIAGNEGDDAWQDMFLMSQCKNNIIANSSFSWWSAWLNRNESKVVVAPEIWFKDSSVSDNMADLLPSDWIKV